MKLLVGLGNAGTKFSLNRHNIGYILIDNILQNYCFSDFKKKGKSYLTKGIIGDLKVILLKPNTFMNNSGESVSEITIFLFFMMKLTYHFPLQKLKMVEVIMGIMA